MSVEATAGICRVDVELGDRGYPILIGSGLLGQENPWRKIFAPGGRILVVTNAIVARWYLTPLLAGLPETATVLVLPDGESEKTLANAERIFEALAKARVTRDGTVVALGGGVIGDLAGFAAACWMRGIRFVQVPTTLLAMVDSSVGGKTGVNIAQGKNLVGAFHQPAMVLADLATLETLPDRQLRAGFAEVVKYGAIGDAEFFAWLEKNAAALCARDSGALAYAVAQSCMHKAGVVSRDERESGERALLNFGHTFGHALEQVTGYSSLLHGEAVAIGMLQAARLSAAQGLADEGPAQRLEGLLAAMGLPTAPPPGLDPQALLDAMALDKKATGSNLRFVLWRGIGAARIVDDVSRSAVRAVLAT